MAHDHREHEGAAKLYELVKDIKVAMMTSAEPDGSLHSRPMYNHTADEAGDLWFFARRHSEPVRELQADAQVNLAFSDTSGQNYVSVSGKAEIVSDAKKKEDLWSEGLRTWLPKGPDDPEVVLIRVHPTGGEYWDGASKTASMLYGYAKAAITGKPAHELSEKKKVSLAS